MKELLQPMSLWLPCGLHGLAVPNTVTVTVTAMCRCSGLHKLQLAARTGEMFQFHSKSLLKLKVLLPES